MTPTASPPLDNPLWAFSIAVYAADGVADECLALQERHGLDVNLLLFAAFGGAVGGVTLSADDVAEAAEAVAAWHADIVRALRAVRQGLKPMSLDRSDPLQAAAAALRTQIKGAELASEKMEQAMLWDWWRRRAASRGDGDGSEALTANLRTILAHYGASSEPLESMRHLRDAALAFAASKS
jgi:uncharacterized protein (TIGR02444 family)